MLAHCGRYQILGEVGSGAMGVVYRARDPIIDRLVAVKVLRQEQTATKSSTKRFLKEARAIGRLSHPNIVTVYDMGEEQGNFYFTMELVEGRSLSEIMKEHRLAIGDTVGIGVQVAKALDYAHRHGVIHQDVKPGNILISKDGRIKITDFGIARLQDTTATVRTKSGEVLGTPAYMSPEQIEGQSVDGRSDIFSLGVVLYELVTGGKPFGRSEVTTLASLLHQILNVSPPDPVEISPDVPKRLSDLIMKALQKDPQQRFQTGGEMAAALRKCLVAPEPARDEVQRAEVAEPSVRKAPQAEVAKQSMHNRLLAMVTKLGIRKALLVAAAVAALVIVVIVYLSVTPPPLTPEERWELSSEPSGAEVGIDDHIAGHTPLALALTLGEHRIRLSHDGYEPFDSSATVLLGKRGSLHATLTPLMASLTITSSPSGAEVSIDGRVEGHTPLPLVLKPGDHRIHVAHDEYEPYDYSATVQPGKAGKLHATMTPLPASLMFTSSPAGAEVVVDGVAWGATPVKMESVKAGEHIVTASLKGFPTQERSILVRGGQDETITFSFKQGPPPVHLALLEIITTPSEAQVYIDNNVKGITPKKTMLPIGLHHVKVTKDGFQDAERDVDVKETMEYPLSFTLQPIVKTGQ